MLVGPSVAGILMTALVHGRAGFRELLSRLLTWRVGPRWYAVALLAGPLLGAATLFALSLTSPVFLPGILTTSDNATLLLVCIVYGLGAGFCEEIGWTGFAVPGLGQRYGVLATGLLVGLLWGAWHFLNELLGKRRFIEGALPGAFPAREPLRHSGTAGLQGAHGVGLRPYREPARGDAHAREFHSQLADPHASGDIGCALLHLVPRMGRRALGRRCCSRRGQRRVALATTAPEAGGLKGVESVALARIAAYPAFAARDLRKTFICVPAEGSPAAETQIR